MKGKFECEYNKDGTLIIEVPPAVLENVHRISLHHAGIAFTTLFTECGAAFGMVRCPLVTESTETPYSEL